MFAKFVRVVKGPVFMVSMVTSLIILKYGYYYYIDYNMFSC